MNELILYAIWLNENCEIFSSAYIYEDCLYYIDSINDMNNLHFAFKSSIYYENNIVNN
jgi:hypothetical protein